MRKRSDLEEIKAKEIIMQDPAFATSKQEIEGKKSEDQELFEREKSKDINLSLLPRDAPNSIAQLALENQALKRALNIIKNEGKSPGEYKSTKSANRISQYSHANYQGFYSQHLVTKELQAAKPYILESSHFAPSVKPVTKANIESTKVSSNSLTAVMAENPIPGFVATSSTKAKRHFFLPHKTNKMHASSLFPPSWANAKSFMPPQVFQSDPKPYEIPVAFSNFGTKGKSILPYNHVYESPLKKAKIGDGTMLPNVGTSLITKKTILITDGGIPNGKKIEGFLFKCGGNEEATIVCHCHGTFFSPAQFVRHAGGGDVDNPAEFITVFLNSS